MIDSFHLVILGNVRFMNYISHDMFFIDFERGSSSVNIFSRKISRVSLPCLFRRLIFYFSIHSLDWHGIFYPKMNFRSLPFLKIACQSDGEKNDEPSKKAILTTLGFKQLHQFSIAIVFAHNNKNKSKKRERKRPAFFLLSIELKYNQEYTARFIRSIKKNNSNTRSKAAQQNAFSDMTSTFLSHQNEIKIN